MKPGLLLMLVIVAAVLVATLFGSSRDSESQRRERDANDVSAGDDPRFLAAEEEALRRWPEFIAALATREPDVAYAVKARFDEVDATEWMWVQVDSIDGDMIHGTLDNEPNRLRNVKWNDRVSVKKANVDDWLVGRDGKVVQGGFTTKVLQQRRQERGDRR